MSTWCLFLTATICVASGFACKGATPRSDLRGDQSMLRGSVHAEGGTLVEGVTITLRGSGADSAREVAQRLSNAQGQFDLGTLPAGKYQLEVRRIGFRPQHHAITLRPGREHQLQIELREAGFWGGPCGHQTIIPFVLVIEPVDRRTGRAVSLAGAYFVATDGAFRDTVEARRNVEYPADTLVHTLAGVAGRAGTYDVLLSVPGYQQWRARRVRVKGSQCGAEPRVLRPRLEPAAR
jgi:hypothetical protein